MELLGHVGVVLTVYAPVAYLAVRRGRTQRAVTGLAVVLALSMTPDVDLYVAGVAHRGVTHTAWAVLVAAAAVALVTTVVSSGSRPFDLARVRFGAIVGGSAVASHLVGDVLTPMGIRPFLPLSATTYTLSLVYAADQRANLTLLVVGALVFTLAIERASVEHRAVGSTPAVETDGGSDLPGAGEIE